MCAIVGIYFKDKSKINFELSVQNMLYQMKHRGPDFSSTYENDNIVLGHNRLSIIDLSKESHQPFVSNDGRYVLIFNGEIYNYRILKNSLKNFYDFQTSSDTEVLLVSYLKWGFDCLKMIKGIFAFAIYDTFKNELFIARDQLGAKPLYYRETENLFIFSSEMRPLCEFSKNNTLCTSGVYDFFHFQSPLYDNTLINGIKQLSPGSYLVVKSNSIDQIKYYSINSLRSNNNRIDYSDYLANLDELLKECVNERLVSDVPFAIALSGGLDSSVLTYIASKYQNQINTITLGFNGSNFDESNYANIIAKKFNTNHHLEMLSDYSLYDYVQSYINDIDFPSSDGLNMYAVSHITKKNGIKVLLSGAGLDELFHGYQFHSTFHKVLKYKNFIFSYPIKKLLIHFYQKNKISRFENLTSNSTPKDIYFTFRSNFSDILISNIFNSQLDFHSSRGFKNQNNCFVDITSSDLIKMEILNYAIPVLLKNMDQNGMSASVEVREPFLNKDLVDFVLKNPSKYNPIKNPKKSILSLYGKYLPTEIYTRAKMGFNLPIENLMRTSLKKDIIEALNSLPELYFNLNEVNDILKKFYLNDKSVSYIQIWSLFIFSKWCKKNNLF